RRAESFRRAWGRLAGNSLRREVSCLLERAIRQGRHWRLGQRPAAPPEWPREGPWLEIASIYLLSSMRPRLGVGDGVGRGDGGAMVGGPDELGALGVLGAGAAGRRFGDPVGPGLGATC